MSCRYPKSCRLRKRREFCQLNRRAKRLVGQYMVIDICESRYKKTRLGITVSRRYGKAVVRNRFKRLVREAFRTSPQDTRDPMDMNVRPRRMACRAAMSQIRQEMIALLEQV